MAIFDDGVKAFLEAYTYFSKMLGKGMEKTAKKFAEEATGVKAPEKLEPVIPGNEVIRIPSKLEKGELMSINSTFSDPLKSDLVLSKIDGTASSKYTALRSETELMFPKFTQDLQYIKDNNIALTTVQKNNILNNLRLKRSLESDIKKLEIDLVRDEKNPRMIYEAYKQSVGKPIKQTKEESLAEAQEMFKGFKPKVIEGGRVNLSKYTDQDLNKLVEEAEEINSQLSLVDQDGSSTLPYKEFQQLSKRKAEIDKIITEAQKVPDVTGNFANDLAKKAGQGKFTKAQVLIQRLENTLKTSKDPYVLENFPNFIKEIKAQPELANNKNVFDTLGGPLPKNQKFVEYDDGTMDFFQKTDFGPQNIAPAKKLAEELGISTKEASAILKMEPEDQVLEIGRRKALADRIDNLVDDTLSEKPTSLYDENFDDYFGPDDKPKQAKGGIVSLV